MHSFVSHLFRGITSKRSILTHHIIVILLFSFFSVLFFNKVLLGFFYDQTSFLSIWPPWRSVIQQTYLINPILSDQSDYKIPLLIKFFTDLSFWHSELSFGTPFIPILSGIFSIINVVFILFEPQLAISISYIFSRVLAGYFMYLFLRDYKISSYISFLGGILYMFSAKAIVSVGTSIGGSVLVFIPLYFLIIKNIFKDQLRYKMISTAIITLVLITSGFPSIAGYIFYAGFLYFLFLTYLDDSNQRKQHISTYIFGTIAGFLLASFVLLPAFEFLNNIADVGYRTDYWKSRLPFIDLFYFINPYFFGNIVLDTWQGGSNLIERGGFYCGILPALFFLTSLYAMYKHKVIEFFFFPLMLMFLLIILFNVGDILSILRYLPIFSGHPSNRLSFLVPFFFVSTCMYGIDKILHTNFKMNKKGLLLSVFSLTFFIFFSIYLFVTSGQNSENWFIYYVVFSSISLLFAIITIVTIYKDNVLVSIVEKRRAQILFLCTLAILLLLLPSLRDLILNGSYHSFKIVFSYYYSSIIIIWIAIIIIFSLLFIAKKYSKIPYALLIVISFIDLFLYTGIYNTPTSKETFYPKTPGTTFLENNLNYNERIMPIGRSFLANGHLPYGIRSVQTHGITSLDYKKLMQQIDPTYLSKHGTAGYIKAKGDLISPLVDLFNVKYIVTNSEITPKYQRIIAVSRYNSTISLEYNHLVEQTFKIGKEEKIDKISLKTAEYFLLKPLKLEMAILADGQIIAKQHLYIENNKRAGRWHNIYFDPPVFTSPGKRYRIVISINRALLSNEYFKLNCLDRNVLESGELLDSKGKELAFRVWRKNAPKYKNKFKLVNKSSFMIYENTSSNRKGIFPIKEIKFIENTDDYLRQLHSDDFFSTAFLKKEDQVFFKQTTFQQNDQDVFNYLEYEDCYIKIKATTRHNGFIKIPDSFYPGWKAFIDGKETDIFQTDLIFRGIKVPSGEHIIEFRYLSQSLRFGAILSLVTLLLLIGYEFYNGRKFTKHI